MKFNVFRCVKDHDGVYKQWEAAFDSEAKAQAWAEEAERCDVDGVFYLVEEEI